MKKFLIDFLSGFLELMVIVLIVVTIRNQLEYHQSTLFVLQNFALSYLISYPVIKIVAFILKRSKAGIKKEEI